MPLYRLISASEKVSFKQGYLFRVSVIRDFTICYKSTHLQTVLLCIAYHYVVIFLGLIITFFPMDYDVGEEEGFITIEMTIREAQIPFTLTLTPTTVDDVLADTRFIATDYLAESFTTLSEAGKATPGGNDLGKLWAYYSIFYAVLLQKWGMCNCCTCACKTNVCMCRNGPHIVRAHAVWSAIMSLTSRYLALC